MVLYGYIWCSINANMTGGISLNPWSTINISIDHTMDPSWDIRILANLADWGQVSSGVFARDPPSPATTQHALQERAHNSCNDFDGPNPVGCSSGGKAELAELKRMRCLRKLILVSRDFGNFGNFGTHGPTEFARISSVRTAKIWLQDTKWQTTSNHSAGGR